jgi:diguanylate cyclase (GGDEF)-like protein
MDQKGRRILVVDDDRQNIETLTQLLSRENHAVTNASDGETALHRVKAWKPHLVLLDVNMPGMTGIELVPRIRAITQDDYASIMLVSADMSLEEVTKGLDAGADDYVTKPFRAQELLARVRVMIRLKELQDSLRRANHRIEELAATDELTGLLSLRALQRRGEEEVQKARRFRKPVSALMINIDQFGAVNDLSGFPFGSHVLRAVGQEIKGCIRSLDLVCRVGADEYFVLLPETDLAGAEFVAERIRDAVHQAEYKSDKHAAKVTVCVGISGISEKAGEGGVADLFRSANEALRSAKLAGPNRVEVYSFT